MRCDPPRAQSERGSLCLTNAPVLICFLLLLSSILSCSWDKKFPEWYWFSPRNIYLSIWYVQDTHVRICHTDSIINIIRNNFYLRNFFLTWYVLLFWEIRPNHSFIFINTVFMNLRDSFRWVSGDTKKCLASCHFLSVTWHICRIHMMPSDINMKAANWKQGRRASNGRNNDSFSVLHPLQLLYSIWYCYVWSLWSILLPYLPGHQILDFFTKSFLSFL